MDTDRTGFSGMQPGRSVTQGPIFRRAPHVFQCSAVAIFKFLISLSLNLCFISEVQWNNGSWTWAQETCTICLSIPCLAPPFAFVMTMSIEFQCTHDMWEFSEIQSKYRVCYTHDWEADSPEKPHFFLEQNLL